MKKRILVICDYYLPSKKSGGGMWTVANVIDRFSDRYDFHVITRNYDSPTDTVPYTTVKTNEWNTLGTTKVYYASNEKLTIDGIAELVNEAKPDCVFLNSVYGTPIVKFLTARRRRKVADIPIVISPTGNLGSGGMAQKWLKKKTFLAIAKALQLYRGVIWKPSTEIELGEVKAVFGEDVTAMVAPDLTPRELIPTYSFDQKPQKESGTVRFLFLSRIVKKKNLGYLLDRLGELGEGSITLDIVGPQEDADHWNECLAKIAKLPANITINIVGVVSYLESLDLMLRCHFFVLPTMHENFGYVFIESLAAGTPVVISENTVWTDVENSNAGWIIELANKQRWVQVLQQCVELDGDEYADMAAASRSYAVNWLSNSDLERATADVFDYALSTDSTQ